MPTQKHPPTIVVIFGAGGDLTWRKLVPALYNLWRDEWLTRQIAIIGVDRRAIQDEEYRKHLREGVDKFSRQTVTNEAKWEKFINRVCYITGDFGEDATYQQLNEAIKQQADAWGEKANIVYYLAIPPALSKWL